MKYLKLVTLAVISGALVVSIGMGSASATELDCKGPSEEIMCAEGQRLSARPMGTLTFHLPFGNINCSPSIEAILANTGGSTATITLFVTSVNFIPCINISNGQMTLHTDVADEAGSSGNGTLTWSGFEFTIESSGFHCKYGTNNTDIGTVTGSKATGSRAVIDIAAEIPRTGGRSGVFCGTAQWTGSLRIETPESLNIK